MDGEKQEGEIAIERERQTQNLTHHLSEYSYLIATVS